MAGGVETGGFGFSPAFSFSLVGLRGFADDSGSDLPGVGFAAEVAGGVAAAGAGVVVIGVAVVVAAALERDSDLRV